MTIEATPAPVKNYITPAGYARLRAELLQLLDVERPEIVSIVSWAAKNGDRSENGDYLYGKRRLREIDRRVGYLSKSLENAQIIDPADQAHLEQVFFGATVVFLRETSQVEETICIVGKDEIDSTKGHVSWKSPIARAMLKSREGDEVRLQTPNGIEILEIIEIKYGD